MADGSRRRVDLGTLPAPARYAIALAVVAAVVVIVVITRPSGAQPSRWYDVVVTVGAIVLLLVGLALLVRLIYRRVRRAGRR